MATVFCRSTDGNDADDGSTWALAKATLAAALTAAGAGGRVYVSRNHAETQATALTLSSPGTAASPVEILCVDDTGDPPTPSALGTTATVTCTGATTMTFGGYAYAYGITFTAGTSGNPVVQIGQTTPWWWKFDKCAIRLGTGTGTNSRIEIGQQTNTTDESLCEWVDTTVQFANASQGISVRAPLLWTGSTSTVTSGTLPTTLFKSIGAGPAGFATVRGVDLSPLGSGKNLVDAAQGNFPKFTFDRCKLGASVQLTTGSNPGQGGPEVLLITSDDADTNYRYQKSVYQGDIYSEITVVKTGGSTDGTTPNSWRMASGPNAKYISPLVSDPIVIWNETVGSAVTISVDVVTDNVTLTDAEAWIEIGYLGTSGVPLALRASDRSADILANASSQDSSSATWTTTGLTTPIKQKLSANITPQEKGPIMVRVCLAKASTTMYVDKTLGLASGRQYQVGQVFENEGAGGSGKYWEISLSG